MLLVWILILGLLLIVAPVIVGTLFTGVDEAVDKLPFRWISGQILLWAGFQAICVPFVLLKQSFSAVVLCFNIFTVAVVVVAVLYYLSKRGKSKAKLRVVEQTSKYTYLLWGIFVVLLLAQLLAAAFLAYEEGDDAYYVAISTITAESDGMYMKHAYTGGSTGLDARHGLAPFPVWVAYLARMSGMPSVMVAQVALPMVLIVMAYALYYCIGKTVLREKKKWLPLFMIIVEVMVLYGGYTTYSAENFLLVRTAQGKAVIAGIVIPLLFLLMFLLVEKLQKDEKMKLSYWILLAFVQMAGCLCSTLGTLLTCMLVGIVGLCVLVCYRRWKLLFPMAACCIMPVCYAALYFVAG